MRLQIMLAGITWDLTQRLLVSTATARGSPPEFGGTGYQVPPGIADSTVPNPVFNLTPAATVDEGNNWINISWGPLAMTHPVSGATLGNYALASGSPAINYIPSAAATYADAPSNDFFGNLRKTNNAVDAGAVEFQSTSAIAIASVTGGPLAFGTVPTNTTSTAHTLTLHNTGTATLTGITLAFSSPLYSRSTAGGTCTGTLNAAAICTINVVFSPAALGLVNATLTVTANVPVTGSPVSLSGTGGTTVRRATLTPAIWTVSQTRNCPTPALGCLADPSQVFTLTNTGNVTLTGIAQGVLGGNAANVANYTIARSLSTCGPNTGGQLTANTTLAPGGTCRVTVQFKPLTAQGTGLKSATVSVTDAAGTQTSTLSGTAR